MILATIAKTESDLRASQIAKSQFRGALQARQQFKFDLWNYFAGIYANCRGFLMDLR